MNTPIRYRVTVYLAHALTLFGIGIAGVSAGGED